MKLQYIQTYKISITEPCKLKVGDEFESMFGGYTYKVIELNETNTKGTVEATHDFRRHDRSIRRMPVYLVDYLG